MANLVPLRMHGADRNIIKWDYIQHLQNHSEIISNFLHYIVGYIVSKLINKLTCLKCKSSLSMILLPTDNMKLASLQLLRHSWTMVVYRFHPQQCTDVYSSASTFSEQPSRETMASISTRQKCLPILYTGILSSQIMAMASTRLLSKMIAEHSWQNLLLTSFSPWGFSTMTRNTQMKSLTKWQAHIKQAYLILIIYKLNVFTR